MFTSLGRPREHLQYISAKSSWINSPTSYWFSQPTLFYSRIFGHMFHFSLSSTCLKSSSCSACRSRSLCCCIASSCSSCGSGGSCLMVTPGGRAPPSWCSLSSSSVSSGWLWCWRPTGDSLGLAIICGKHGGARGGGGIDDVIMWIFFHNKTAGCDKSPPTCEDAFRRSALNQIPGKSLLSLEHSSFNKLNLDYSVRLVSRSFQTAPF